MKFIVGFNRDRDGYEVPAALSEADELSALVTDYYHGRSFPPMRGLAHRKSGLIPASLVRTVPGALTPQIVHEVEKRFGLRTKFPAQKIDDSIAEAVARESVKRPNDGLLVYSNYAWRAFENSAASVRLLFQYHPNNQVINDAMKSDELGGLRNWQKELEEVDSERQRKEQIEVRHATGVICASTFTARGAVLAGVPLDRIRVVPYGCPTPPGRVNGERDKLFLFVGQGVQRKGLHLLAEAWRRLHPADWRLRIVASRIDPEIARVLDGLPGVEVSNSVSRAELTSLYSTASALVLPSLVEGFGLVFGEALSFGCSVIGTANTGLPDLGLPEPAGRECRPGSVEDLAEAMRQHIHAYESGQVDPIKNSKLASERSWGHFRVGIRAAVSQLSPT